MRVCVCLGHNKRRRQRRKGERRQGKRDGKKWAKGWPGPHLTPTSPPPCPALAWLANVKFVESWPNTFDGKDGRAQLAGDAGTSLVYPHSPFPPPLLHMPTVCRLRLCMYVCVGRSLASFLYAIEHTLMLYDVVMLVKMLVHTHAPL